MARRKLRIEPGGGEFGRGYTKTDNQSSDSNWAKKVKIDCCLQHNKTVFFFLDYPAKRYLYG